MARLILYADYALGSPRHSAVWQHHLLFLIQNVLEKSNVKYFQLKDDDRPIAKSYDTRAATAVKSSAWAALDV